MRPIGRKYLPHNLPPNISENPEGEVYFVTICCLPRGVNQLAKEEVWAGIVETVERRETMGLLRAKIVLAMPDHLHGLFMFRGNEEMLNVVGDMKSWLAKRYGIRWQRDFFDHRLRGWESAVEKGNYIRDNPVRAGLVEKKEDWKFVRDGNGR